MTSIPSSTATLPEVHSSNIPDASSSYVESLKNSDNDIVQGMGDLDSRCGNKKIFSGVMQFLNVSATDAQAWQDASLEQSIDARLTPISIVDLDGLDLTDPEQNKTAVDNYMTALFSDLRQSRVSPSALGPFVVCPEFIAGYGAAPQNYAPNLNMFLTSLHAAAPEAPASNMIDLSEATALEPYFKDVNHDLLQTVGIQAFANGAPIPFNSDGTADVSGFISAAQIKTISAAFGDKPLWLNTGITRTDANLPNGGISYTLNQRLAIGAAIADVVAAVQHDGVAIETVNLFAENKLSGTDPTSNAEKRDFSFHSGDEPILLAFAGRMQALGIKLSGFALAHDYSTAAH